MDSRSAKRAFGPQAMSGRRGLCQQPAWVQVTRQIAGQQMRTDSHRPWSPGGCFRGLRRTGLDAGSGRVRLGVGGRPGADINVFNIVLGLEFMSDDGMPKAEDDGLACNAWRIEAL